MIVIILFATFISFFFQTTVYYDSIADNNRRSRDGFFFEGMENQDESMDVKEPATLEADLEADLEDDSDLPITDKKLKQPIDEDEDNGESKEIEKKHKKVPEKDNKKKPVQVTKAAQLKQDMAAYFDVQKKLLDVLEKAEPLQEEAAIIKERFTKNTQNG